MKNYTVTITPFKSFGQEGYHISFFSYGSEEGTQQEGYDYVYDRQEAYAMKDFYLANPRAAIMFMSVTKGHEYDYEDV